MMTQTEDSTVSFPCTKTLNLEFKQELEAILQWWIKNMLDQENGGFHGRMDGQGNLHPKADRGIILNTRIVWTFSAAARFTGNPLYRSVAEHALTYVLHYFWDSLEGGVFWSVDWRGNPSNTQKQIYAQAFAIYAFAEYFLLTNNASVLEKAAELFWLTEKYSHDRVKGGYFSAFARDWSSMDDIRLSEKDANESKIMNTHLHLLEAYTNLYRCTNSASVRSGLEYISDIMISRFYNKNNGHLHIYFDDDWQVKGNLISFGHDIEASWLLYEAAELLGESQIIKTTPVSVHLAEATFSQGLTANGLNYEIHENGSTDTDKHWWPQTEGVVGFWNAWQLTGRLVFANASASLWGFIKNHILDKNEGEWHWRVNEKGIPALEEDKAGPWKCPYHNGRMCMEMLKRLIGS